VSLNYKENHSKMSDDGKFRVSKEHAEAERLANNERKKVKPTGERSSMYAWMTEQTKTTPMLQIQGGPKMFSMEEVVKHNTATDNWMVVRGVVYDVTHFQKFHPGGDTILAKYAGRDVSEIYDAFHKWVNAESMLQNYVLGRLIPPS
jgi:cytochrome b involved in lipid metabolism